MTMTNFQKACKSYKATARIQKAILNHKGVDKDDWEDAQETFPSATDAEWVARWSQAILGSGLKKSAPLPAKFWEQLETRISGDARAGAWQSSISTVSTFTFIIIFIVGRLRFVFIINNEIELVICDIGFIHSVLFLIPCRDSIPLLIMKLMCV